MATLILGRSMHRNWICSRPTVRHLSSSSSSSASSSPRPWLLIQDHGIKNYYSFNVPGVDENFDENFEKSIINDYSCIANRGFDLPDVDEGLEKLVYNFYSLADNKVTSYDKRRAKDAVVVGSSHGWLALYKRRCDMYRWRHENNSGFEMFLYNPVSQHQVILPSVESLPMTITGNIDTSSPECKTNRPKKVILSCSPRDNEEECRAIMSYGPEDRLAYCCPGSSKHWIPIGDFYHENEPINEELIKSGYTTDSRYPRIYEDFVYSTAKKQLLCTTKFDNFECWDISDPVYPKLNWKKIPGDGLDYDADNYPFPLGDFLQRRNGLCRTFKYLVYAEKLNRIFLVRRIVMEQIGPKKDRTGYRHFGYGPYQTVDFDVHEIIVDNDDDPAGKKGELRYIGDGDGRSLDGMAFFIGSTGDGFVVEEESHKMMRNNVKPNCIYFTDPKELTPLPWVREASFGGHDIGIFNYKNRAFSTLYKYPCDLRCIHRYYPTPTWFTPSSC